MDLHFIEMSKSEIKKKNPQLIDKYFQIIVIH